MWKERGGSNLIVIRRGVKLLRNLDLKVNIPVKERRKNRTKMIQSK